MMQKTKLIEEHIATSNKHPMMTAKLDAGNVCLFFRPTTTTDSNLILQRQPSDVVTANNQLASTTARNIACCCVFDVLPYC